MKCALWMQALGLVLLALTCTGWAAQTESSNNGYNISELTIGTTNQVDSINTFGGGAAGNYFAIFSQCLSMQGLVRLTMTGVDPELATSWETDDVKKWIFHIRDDAKWHDGLPVTAQDVKFTIDYSLEKDPSAKSTIGNVESVEAVNDTKVIINLRKPDYNFLTMLTRLRIIPEHIYKSVEDPLRFNDEKAALGCGPYKFVSLDTDAGILTFKANKDYWGPKPAAETVKIRMFKNNDALMLAFQKGEVDLPHNVAGTGISYYYVPRLLGNKDIHIEIYPNLGITNSLWLNNAKAPFDDKEFRQALSYAVNYEEMKNMFAAGYGTTPSAGWVPNGTLYHIETRPLVQDLNKSKSMLDNLDFKDVDGDGFREMPDGSRFQPRLLTGNFFPDNVRVAEILKTYFTGIGLDLQIDVQDRSTTFDILEQKRTQDMYLGLCIASGMMMGEGYGTFYNDPRYLSWTNVKGPEYQSIVDNLAIAQEPEKRKELAENIQKYYAEEMPEFTVYSQDIIQPYNAKYEGWEFSPMFGVLSYGTIFNLHNA